MNHKLISGKNTNALPSTEELLYAGIKPTVPNMKPTAVLKKFTATQDNTTTSRDTSKHSHEHRRISIINNSAER